MTAVKGNDCFTSDPNLAVLVARAYDAVGDYKGEMGAWQIVANANPTIPTYFADLAASAYRAKNVRLGDLAAAKAVSLTPKARQFELRQQLNQLKTAISGAGATQTVTAGG